jgi:integrase
VRSGRLAPAEQIVAMIEAATEIDAKPEARTARRRAVIATLIYAGLRIGEATALRWRDIDPANGRISVGDSKTARQRVIRPVVAAADGLLARRGHAPLPEGVTAHKLRTAL